MSKNVYYYFYFTELKRVPIDSTQQVADTPAQAGHYRERAQAFGVVLCVKHIRVG